MEIEFNDDAHEATGAKPCLQLKSGDSCTGKRRGDGAEIFTLKKPRHAEYWMAQAFPVLLVIRNSEGEVRWMEVRDWLKRASDNGKKAVKQIVFEGVKAGSARRVRHRELPLPHWPFFAAAWFRTGPAARASRGRTEGIRVGGFLRSGIWRGGGRGFRRSRSSGGRFACPRGRSCR